MNKYKLASSLDVTFLICSHNQMPYKNFVANKKIYILEHLYLYLFRKHQQFSLNNIQYNDIFTFSYISNAID